MPIALINPILQSHEHSSRDRGVSFSKPNRAMSDISVRLSGFLSNRHQSLWMASVVSVVLAAAVLWPAAAQSQPSHAQTHVATASPDVVSGQKAGSAAVGDAYWSNPTSGHTPSHTPAAVSATTPALPNASEPAIGDSYWTNNARPQSSGLPSGPRTLDGAKANSLRRSAGEQVEIARESMLREAAMTYGVQAGMDARAAELNAALRTRSADYDKVFNFAAIQLEPGFLPPVITEGRDAYKQNSDTQVRVATRVYRIEFPARLTNVPPNWREYLPLPISGVAPPHGAVLPKTRAEREIWDYWVENGWHRGVVLADETFQSNLARLRRDFEGMLRFKQLYEQGVVSKPVLARDNMGVTGGGNEMAVDDRVAEITVPSGLDPDRSLWRRALPATSTIDLPADEPRPYAPRSRR